MLGRAEPMVELTTSMPVKKTTVAFFLCGLLGAWSRGRGLETYCRPIIGVLWVVNGPCYHLLVCSASCPGANVVKSPNASVRRLLVIARLGIDFVELFKSV